MDMGLMDISLRRKQLLADSTLRQVRNITLLYSPERKSRWFRYRALKAKCKGSRRMFSSRWDTLRATRDWKRLRRSRKLYSGANCARLRGRSQRWSRVWTAGTISTWRALRMTAKFPSGTFATSAVLNGRNKCGSRKGGFNRNRRWWRRSCRNWYPKKPKRKRRRRSILNVTPSSHCDIRIMCRTIRNLNIPFKINF